MIRAVYSSPGTASRSTLRRVRPHRRHDYPVFGVWEYTLDAFTRILEGV